MRSASSLRTLHRTADCLRMAHSPPHAGQPAERQAAIRCVTCWDSDGGFDLDYQEIRDLIANARKKTPVTVFVRHDGELAPPASEDVRSFPTGAGTTILTGEWEAIEPLLQNTSILY